MELFVKANGFPFVESLSEPQKGIYRIAKADVEHILNNAKKKDFNPPEIMCKENVEDEAWVIIYPEDLNDDGTLDENYQIFEIWNSEVETNSNTLPVTKHFPRGFDSWQETYFEITVHLMETMELKGQPANKRFSAQGRGGLYEMAEEMTDAFEKSNLNSDWDGEFFDTIAQWVCENGHLFSCQQDVFLPKFTY